VSRFSPNLTGAPVKIARPPLRHVIWNRIVPQRIREAGRAFLKEKEE
jgi:hypothetical protein